MLKINIINNVGKNIYLLQKNIIYFLITVCLLSKSHLTINQTYRFYYHGKYDFCL